MAIKQYLTLLGLLAAGTSAIPQQTSASITPSDSSATATSVSPEQSSEFRSALNTYYSGLQDSPEFSNVAVALALADGSALDEIRSNPSALLPMTATSLDLLSLASDPPTSFPSYSWYSGLDPGLVSSIQSLQTSAALAIASLDQSVLGTSFELEATRATGAAAGSSSPSGAANANVAVPTGLAAAGAAIGALGAAVAML